MNDVERKYWKRHKWYVSFMALGLCAAFGLINNSWWSFSIPMAGFLIGATIGGVKQYFNK